MKLFCVEKSQENGPLAEKMTTQKEQKRTR